MQKSNNPLTVKWHFGINSLFITQFGCRRDVWDTGSGIIHAESQPAVGCAHQWDENEWSRRVRRNETEWCGRESRGHALLCFMRFDFRGEVRSVNIVFSPLMLATTCLVVAVYATFPFIYKRGKIYKYFPANKKTNQSALALFNARIFYHRLLLNSNLNHFCCSLFNEVRVYFFCLILIRSAIKTNSTRTSRWI